MTSYFNSAESVAMLDRLGRSWLGTPFIESQAVPGPAGGVSCHLLCARVLAECGAIPAVGIPEGSAKGSRRQRLARMEDWIDQNLGEWLQRACRPFQPGDLLTFSFGHMGLVMPGPKALRLLHCLKETGVQIHELSDPTWLGSVSRCWRPTLSSESERARRACA